MADSRRKARRRRCRRPTRRLNPRRPDALALPLQQKTNVVAGGGRGRGRRRVAAVVAIATVVVPIAGRVSGRKRWVPRHRAVLCTERGGIAATPGKTGGETVFASRLFERYAEYQALVGGCDSSGELLELGGSLSHFAVVCY